MPNQLTEQAGTGWRGSEHFPYTAGGKGDLQRKEKEARTWPGFLIPVAGRDELLRRSPFKCHWLVVENR